MERHPRRRLPGCRAGSRGRRRRRWRRGTSVERSDRTACHRPSERRRVARRRRVASRKRKRAASRRGRSCAVRRVVRHPQPGSWRVIGGSVRVTHRPLGAQRVPGAQSASSSQPHSQSPCPLQLGRRHAAVSSHDSLQQTPPTQKPLVHSARVKHRTPSTATAAGPHVPSPPSTFKSARQRSLAVHSRSQQSPSSHCPLAHVSPKVHGLPITAVSASPHVPSWPVTLSAAVQASVAEHSRSQQTPSAQAPLSQMPQPGR